MSEVSRKNSDLCDSDNCEEIDKNCNKLNKDSDKDHKDCCCGIDTLRKILEIFQREDISVNIATRGELYSGFIFDITEDLVYISENLSDSPTQFIPLCNISISFAFITDNSLADEIREEIISIINPTCNTNPCCCTDGIADTINDIRRFSDPTNFLIIDIQSPPLDGTTCFGIGDILAANDDVVFIDIPAEGNIFVIIPTCAIGSLLISDQCQ